MSKKIIINFNKTFFSMDCKVFVIVDFDNFFPRPIPEIPINKIEFLFKEIVRDIITNVHNVQNIIIRIYGGWYQDDTLTNRASQLLSILKLISDGIFPVVIEQRKIEGSIDMVFSLFKVAHVWYNTYQERSGLPKLRIAHTTVQRNYPIGSVDLNRNHSSDVLV